MSNSRTSALLCCLAGLGGSSMIYFLCLAGGLPFTAFIALLLIICTGLAWWYRRNPTTAEGPHSKSSWFFAIILIAGTFLITNRSYYLAQPDGGWDAWGIWNAHARFLLSGTYWTNLFRSVVYDHPDYPLCLPAIIAWITRIAGQQHIGTVAFALSFWITLITPLLIFTALWGTNKWIAGATLLYFATSDFYLFNGTSQYADTWLAAFFLSAIIALRYAAHDRRMAGLATFFAGCAAWTKNEGLVIALLLPLFYAPVFFSRRNIRCTMWGGLLPLITLIIFKCCYAPSNDLFQQNGQILSRLQEAHRYGVVWQYFLQNGKDYFLPVAWLLLAYVAACLLFRQPPGKGLWLILACLVTYMLVYILSPYDPEWHVRTSQDRLMLQMLPALIYVLADGFAALRLPRLSKQ